MLLGCVLCTGVSHKELYGEDVHCTWICQSFCVFCAVSSTRDKFWGFCTANGPSFDVGAQKQHEKTMLFVGQRM